MVPQIHSRSAYANTGGSRGLYVPGKSGDSPVAPSGSESPSQSAAASQPSGSLVSVSSAGAIGNGASSGVFNKPLSSSDGRYVAFSSSATNLVAGDTNGVSDVFVRDRQTATTTRVSVSTGGTQANGGSSALAASSDGRYVIFESNATNLVSSDRNGVYDLFLRDRTAGTTTRVSVSATGGELNATSTFQGVSKNGRYVAFRTSATNVGTPGQAPANIFIRDVVTNTTTGFFYNYNGVTPDGDASDLHISDNGQFIEFSSTAVNITQSRDYGVCGQTGGGDKMRYLRDSSTGVNAFLKDSVIFASYSSDNGVDMTVDGRYVLYGVSCLNLNRVPDGGFYRYDRVTGINDAVVLRHPAPYSWTVVGVHNISEDGKRVFIDMCFAGGSASCTPNEEYIWDQDSSYWIQMTNFFSDGAVVGDGKNVVLGTNLILDPIDTNGVNDVYMLAAPPRSPPRDAWRPDDDEFCSATSAHGWCDRSR
ncbi:MAG: TolB family protein [Actinomycetota bacterium]